MTERLYFTDSFLASFEARVSDIRQVSQRRGEIWWQVTLDRTAFYPTSGGQPYDTGVLEAVAPSGARLRAPIAGVEEDEAGEIWHTTAKPLLAGTLVRGEIDWSRRHDHMQQHSGQHLLSAIFQRETGAATVSFHLGEAVSTIDLDISTLSTTELERVEEAANAAIAEDHAIAIRMVGREEAESLLAAGSLRKLPPRKGEIRLIEIEGLDLNACGGTHLRSTAQIGSLLIRGVERAKQQVRVEFACGMRAVRLARLDRALLHRTAMALSVGKEETPGAVERILEESKAAAKEQRRLAEALAEAESRWMVREIASESGRRLVIRRFADRDASFLKLLAGRLAAAAQTCALLTSEVEDPSAIVLAANSDLGLDCGVVLKGALGHFGARGGGAAVMGQGRISRAEVGGLLKHLEPALRGLLGAVSVSIASEE